MRGEQAAGVEDLSRELWAGGGGAGLAGGGAAAPPPSPRPPFNAMQRRAI